MTGPFRKPHLPWRGTVAAFYSRPLCHSGRAPQRAVRLIAPSLTRGYGRDNRPILLEYRPSPPWRRGIKTGFLSQGFGFEAPA